MELKVQTSIGELTLSIPQVDMLDLSERVIELHSTLSTRDGHHVCNFHRLLELFSEAVVKSISVVHQDFTEDDLRRMPLHDIDNLAGAVIAICIPQMTVARGGKPRKPN